VTEIVIDEDRALELLRNRIRGNEDFVYQRHEDMCFYIYDGCPSCLIGQVLHDAGVSIEDLSIMDGNIENGYDTDIASLYLERLLPDNLSLTWPAIQIFVFAQGEQDKGISWGQVLTDLESWRNSVRDSQDQN